MTRTYKYSKETVSHVYNNLLNFKNQGNAKDYEIRIDDLTVVQRTKNMGNFHLFKKALYDYSMDVSIFLYKGNSRKYDKYILERKGKVSPNANQTTQEFIDEQVAKKIAEQNRQIENSRLLEENKQLKKRVKRLKRQNEKLEDKQTNGLKDLITLVTTSLPHLTGNNSDIPTEINGIKTTDLLKMINEKRVAWGDEVFTKVIAVTLTIGEHTELLNEVEQKLLLKNKKNENKEK